MSTSEHSRAKPAHNVNDFATAETRRKGAYASLAVRRENAKTFRQRLGEKLDEQADDLIAAAVRAGNEGDWRATVALVEQAFGKAPERVAVDHAGTVSIEHERRLSLGDVADLARQLAASENREHFRNKRP